MAYSTPRTWVAGEYPTAAQFNANLRDNLNAAFPFGVDAWTAYTPTLTQSATVTKTVTYAKYQRVGRLIVAQVLLAVTGTGTGANAVAVGLPVTAATSSVDLECGSGHIVDASAAAVYKGFACLATTTTIQLRPSSTTTTGFLGADTFTAALASGDLVTYNVMYESAT